MNDRERERVRERVRDGEADGWKYSLLNYSSRLESGDRWMDRSWHGHFYKGFKSSKESGSKHRHRLLY